MHMREFEFSTRMKAETFGRWFDREIGTECEVTADFSGLGGPASVVCVEMTAGELRRAAVEAAEVERLG
jgi:hypothetical protein